MLPESLQELIETPFFQQRLERFLFTEYRIELGGDIGKLSLFMLFPPFPPQKKASVVFFGDFKGIPILYEADRWNEPRTGAFVKVGPARI